MFVGPCVVAGADFSSHISHPSGEKVKFSNTGIVIFLIVQSGLCARPDLVLLCRRKTLCDSWSIYSVSVLDKVTNHGLISIIYYIICNSFVILLMSFNPSVLFIRITLQELSHIVETTWLLLNHLLMNTINSFIHERGCTVTGLLFIVCQLECRSVRLLWLQKYCSNKLTYSG